MNEKSIHIAKILSELDLLKKEVEILEGKVDKYYPEDSKKIEEIAEKPKKKIHFVNSPLVGNPSVLWNIGEDSSYSSIPSGALFSHNNTYLQGNPPNGYYKEDNGYEND